MFEKFLDYKLHIYIILCVSLDYIIYNIYIYLYSIHIYTLPHHSANLRLNLAKNEPLNFERIGCDSFAQLKSMKI